MPYSEEAERGVLGAILVRSVPVLELCFEKGLEADKFYLPVHRELFETIIDMVKDPRCVIDLLTLGDRLGKNKDSRIDPDSGFLEALVDHTPTAAHAEHYIEIVMEKARLRKLSEVAENVQIGIAEERSSDEISVRAESELFDLDSTGQEDVSRSSKNAILNAWHEAGTVGFSGVPSGFPELNGLLGGYHEYTILAARPGQGKSTLMLNEALYQARNGHSVAVASLEMSRTQCIKRMACNLADLPLFRMDCGEGTPLDYTYGLQSG
ncbi:MAG: DnaB-like helicase N-terminal domain-containing protein, partial [Verrucomicrobiota bacterium]